MLKLTLKPIVLMMAVALFSVSCGRKGSVPPPPPSKESPGATRTGTNNTGDRQNQPSEEQKKEDTGSEGNRDKKPQTITVGDKTLQIKDVQVDAVTTGTSASGVNAASHGDAAWNPPGLPYPVADSPIFTGAETWREYKATDMNDDHLMAYLVTLANEQMDKDKDFGTESLVLAKAISRIHAEVNRSNSKIYIRFDVKSGDRTVRIVFDGRMTANRRVVLFNTETKTDYMEVDRKRANLYKERKFRLTMMCVDKTTGCESVIMRLDQLFLKPGVDRKTAKESDWELCRSVYALTRHGNVHTQISEHDYINHVSYPNQNQKQFLSLLKNTAHYVRYITKSLQSTDLPRPQRPRLESSTVDFFAVAYGYANFEIALEAAREMNTAGIRGSNKTIFQGPMLWASSTIANDNVMYPYGEYNDANAIEYASGIETAKLKENDGRGQIAVNFVFKGLPYAASQVNFTTLFAETVNPFEQRAKEAAKALSTPEIPEKEKQP